MADEPTGALDSNTGRQVLDTLKRLSENKLVIVVSHDRDFAEQYADRIIELADGRVISDLEYINDGAGQAEEGSDGLIYSGNTVTLPSDYHLTEEDRAAINEYIDSIAGGEVKLQIGGRLKRGRTSRPTDTGRIAMSEKAEFKPIKSRLPMKNAFKIGASGLKHKKFRLVVTILLSCVAFGLFGLSDTFGAYNHIKTCTQSIIDTGVDYASVIKSVRFDDGKHSYFRSWGYHVSDSEIADIGAKTGVKMKGVYSPLGWDMTFNGQYNANVEFTQTDYHIYAYSFNGFAEITRSDLDRMGYTLIAGSLPDGSKNEIAVSKYVCETFIKGGYADISAEYDQSADGRKYESIASYDSMVGKTLTLNNEKFTVTGVIDTNFDLSRYQNLTVKNDNESTSDMLISYALYNELNYIRGYSLNQVAIVGDGFIDRLLGSVPTVKELYYGDSMLSFSRESEGNYLSIYPSLLGTMSDIKNHEIIWVNGVRTELGEKEIIVSSDAILSCLDDSERYSGKEPAEIALDFLKENNSVTKESRKTYDDDITSEEGYKIVGIIDQSKYTGLTNTVIACKSLCKEFLNGDDGIYAYAVGAMPKEKAEIHDLVSYCYNEDSDVRYEMMNSVTYELDMVNEALKMLSKVFLYIGIGFAVFASIMLANFIGTSISYKKQEIGILRAIGSRSNDVFRIFFSESFIIAMINFFLSSAGVFAATTVINYFIRSRTGILITVLSFGVRQVALLLIVSIAIAALASFLPVKKIASKRPIDAIRNR
jgi:putative ABC transport system permease protein